MPPLPLLSAFVDYTSSLPLDLALNTRDSTPSSAAEGALQVVCAWPLSSQYGPGSRFLYYVLIAACVLAREAEWIRNACLAAALLLPTIAALHAIVLAAVHVDGAVDMDIYGAFQLCSIGILAAPVTVRLSKTYLYDPGRNTIFAWAGLILAGLISLTVEFYRIQTLSCTDDGSGHAISPDASRFPYGVEPICGLTCNVVDGPFSPMRGGSANNIYVIPAPERLKLGTAMLLSAACGVQAIVWLLSMTEKIMEINWKSQSRQEDFHEPIEGTNGATKGSMKVVNDKVKIYLSMAVIPIFGGAGLAILIVGEINFFSEQLRYQNEPMEAIGQWGSIVGVGLALLGSLYLVLAADMEAERNKEKAATDSHFHCQCAHHPRGSSNSQVGIDVLASPDLNPRSPHRHVEEPSHEHAETASSIFGNDHNGRRKLAKFLLTVSDSLGNRAHDRFENSDFQLGASRNWPEIPGEELRSPMLHQIKEQYDPPRDADGNATPLPRSRSRASSFLGAEERSENDRSPSLPPTRRRSNTVPVRQASLELLRVPSSPGPMRRDQSRGRPRFRRDMLEIPPSVSSHAGLGISQSRSPDVSPHAMAGGRNSDHELPSPSSPPVIRVSAETSSREESPATPSNNTISAQ